MEEQQKLGGIGLHSCFPHLAWSPTNILVAALEKGSYSWEEAQGNCTHISKFSGVRMSSSMKVHMYIVRLLDVFVKSRCLDVVLTHQLGVRGCLVINQILEIMGAKNIGAQYKKHSGEDTPLLLGHEQNSTVFVAIPELVLSLLPLDLLTDVEPQSVCWIALMPVVTCVEVLDAHEKWDHGRFLSIMSAEQKTNHTERSRRLQRIGAQGYRLIIGMNDLLAPWDPGIVAIYESVVPVHVKDRRAQC
jgi:hypothetical protein